MKPDILKEAQRRAAKETHGMRFESVQAMREYLEFRTKTWVRKLHATDKSHLRGGEYYG